jgi:hypothetical protein
MHTEPPEWTSHLCMGITRCIPLLLWGLTAPAQQIVDPGELPETWTSFERPAKEERLPCRTEPVQPLLNLGFRFQTGYRVEVPASQLIEGDHWWSVVVRVSPEENAEYPVWLLSRMKVPAGIKDKRSFAQFAGSYLVGEGSYQVDLRLMDDRGHACTAAWRVRARLSSDVKQVGPGLPAGKIDDWSSRNWSKPARSAEGPRYKVAILLHASAAIPGRVLLHDYDRHLLISALSSLTERLPASIRLTVFSMDKQKEIYHADDLSGTSFREAVRALNKLETGTVDYSTLGNRTGHAELVAELLNREKQAETPPDMIVVLGPLAHWTDRIRDTALTRGEQSTLPVYYVQLRPWRPVRATIPDTLSQAVKALGGKTKEVYSPVDFAEAIQDVTRILSRRDASPLKDSE